MGGEHGSGLRAPLVLRDGRLRLPPDLDLEEWALSVVRRLILEAVGDRPVRVWLFGSRARGDARPSSDLDIALDAGEPLPREWVASLRERLEDSAVPFEVELVDLALAGSELREAVRREGVAWT